MRRTRSLLRPVLVAASAGLLLVAPGAHPVRAPASALHLSVAERGEEELTEATLTCAPAGGSHPRAAAACETLRQVHGRFGDLPTTGDPCTMEYRPTVGEVTGHWLGEPVRFRHTYENPCLAARESGGVLALAPRPDGPT
ncbi:SSI family serine proteinase inhibitor [Halostreptopolyspora alba]|uniref:Subtilisin inhibitor domain-containing protein n=1 Tax=Halostreptopolyspora alba TaxID=2487137 RepID=A0A3N0EB41_9ACTN|nr:hypothetical protein EFW17_10365 [Nocardiopsaceae bacterium YIM 96095]